MFLVTVIPIAKAISKEQLTYFSLYRPDLGSVVSITLRNKKTFGLVTLVKDVSEKKTEIKRLPYGMKRLSGTSAKHIFTADFISTVSSLAQYFATTPGAVLHSLVPKVILEAMNSLPEISHQMNKGTYELLALQMSHHERFDTYKSRIREEFARKKSVFLLAPTIAEIETAEKFLEKGIEHFTYVFHSGLSKKILLERWKRVATETHPVLIIATGYFLSLPRQDIGSIIVDHESARAFHEPTRPFLDMRTVAEMYARQCAATCIMGDQALRVETIVRRNDHEINDLSPLQFRALSPIESVLIDARMPKQKEFSTLTPELEKVIANNQLEGKRMILVCARTGLATLTACADCGETVSCDNCGAALVLRENKKERIFSCNICGKTQSAEMLCKRCQSWKLVPLGIGVEGVAKEIQDAFPDISLFVMDKKNIAKFYATPGSVFLCTPGLLPFLDQKVETTAIVSIDTYFALPDFRMEEYILHTILTLREMTTRCMIIQTRRPEEKIFDYALKGNLTAFYEREIALRKRMNFPPFELFIRLTIVGKKADARKKMEQIREMLRPYELAIFEAFHPGSEKFHTIHGLIRLARGRWPEALLIEKLHMLPPDVAVEVEPESLL